MRFVLLWGGGLLLTAAWLVVCAYYVDVYIGWDNLLILLPHEIGAFFAGAFAPLAFFWIVLLYYGGGGRIERAARQTDKLRRQYRELASAANTAQVQVTKLGDAFQKRSQELLARSESAVTNVHEAGDALEQQVKALGDASAEAVTEAASIGETFQRQADDLTAASGQAAVQSERIEQILERQEKEFSRIAKALEAQTNAIDEAARRYTEEFARISDDASAKTDAAGESLRGQADELSTASRQGIDQISAVGEALGRQADVLNDASDNARALLEKNRDALDAETQAFAAAASAAVEKMQNVGALFRDQSQELTRSTGKASEEVTAVARELGGHLKGIDAALDGALARTSEGVTAVTRELGEQIKGIDATLEGALAKARELAQVFAEEASTLAEAADHAESQAKKVRLNALDERRDVFLRASKLIVEDLNTIGLDINRVIAKQNSDRMWQKFIKGDKGVFVRSMLAMSDKKAEAVIKKRYKDDEKFRGYVSRYLEQFEQLLVQASESDPENLLSSTFVTADVGKLYLLLSRAVGRMN